ncbi:MAG TPA: DUF115 domain-containing protein [Syntrophales bacterium]|nr:DUF115 domain-containing protein [Syntrophales bacterium]
MSGHLDANLAALRERCPDFLAWWEKCPSQPGEYNLLSSLSGLPDLEIVRPGGQRIILYNRENPFETIQKELADQSFPKGSLTFLFGLGLGYRALHILSTMEPGHAVYIVERDPDILRLALALHDYSAEIRSGKITFVVPEEEALRRFAKEQDNAILNGRIRLFLESFTRLLDPGTARMHDICHSQFNTVLMNFHTVVKIGGTVIQNEVENLPRALLGWNPEGLLSGTFRNRPAIIVATGPSLQRNISLLREAQGRALIITVGQSLRILLAYDIHPDIVCSIDFGEPNYRSMSDAIDMANMPLLIHPQVYPRIPREYRGDVFVPLDRNSILLPASGKVSPPLGNAMTVAQTALNLALAAGADPIIFTGQDLSYGESSHIAGATYGKQVTVQGSRIIMKRGQNTRDHEVYWVPGYFGGQVPTHSGLLAFLEDIENTIRHHPGCRFINATEGGARIAGTERMSMRDVLETCCRQEFPVSEYLAEARQPLGVDPRRLCRMLETSRNHMERLLKNASRLEQMCGEMKSLFPQNGEPMPQKRNQLDALNRKALKSFSSLLNSLEEDRISRLATVRVKYLLIQMEEQLARPEENHDAARRTIRYCEALCEGLKEACPPILEKIRNVHPLIDEYATLSESIEAAPPGTETIAKLRLRLGNCLRRMGHPGMATEEFERATVSDACRDTALEELFALHLDGNRFETAGHCLQRLSAGHLKRNAFQDLLVDKRERERERLLERARLCLDRGDFVGCLLACRTIHDNAPDVRQMIDHALKIREKKVHEAGTQVQREWENARLRDEREQRLGLARLKMKEKDYAAALDLFHDLTRSDPRDEEAGLGCVRACKSLEDWQRAEAELQRLMEHHPEKSIYYRELGNVLLHRGKSEGAIKYFNKAVELDQGGDELCLKIAATLSGAGKAAEALPFFERHMKDNPNDYRALVLWGDGFLRLGILQAAMLSWETALRIRPGYGPAVERLNRLQPAANS